MPQCIRCRWYSYIVISDWSEWQVSLELCSAYFSFISTLISIESLTHSISQPNQTTVMCDDGIFAFCCDQHIVIRCSDISNIFIFYLFCAECGYLMSDILYRGFVKYCTVLSSMWAWEFCRISSRRFLAEFCKRWLNQGCFVLLCFVLFAVSELYLVCVCAVSFVSISQVIGCEDRLWDDLDCVGQDIKLHSNSIACYYWEEISCPVTSAILVGCRWVCWHIVSINMISIPFCDLFVKLYCLVTKYRAYVAYIIICVHISASRVSSVLIHGLVVDKYWLWSF